MKVLRINRPSVSFYKDLWCEKKTLQDIFFRGMGFFFLDFITQYFVDIFSEPPKKIFANKFWKRLTFDNMSQKEQTYKDVWYQRTTM